MKKIMILAHKFIVWWLFNFKNKVLHEVEFDAYKVVFRKYTMEITTKSGNLKLQTTSMTYPNAFLFQSIADGDVHIVEWFCNTIYQFTTLITTDVKLVQDVDKAFARYYKRMAKKAEELAKEVSEEDETLAIEQVKFNQEYAKKTRKERKEYKKMVKDELTKMSKDE